MQITMKNTDFMTRAITALKEGAREDVLTEIGEDVGKTFGQFAPYNPEGSHKHLRDDYRVDVAKNYVSVVWGYHEAPTEAYAHYQYEGVVYGPNYFIGVAQGPMKNGSAGVPVWRSPKGKGTKHRTSKHLGTPGSFEYKGKTITLGYSTPGTGDHWIEKARYTPTVFNPLRVRIMQRLKVAIGERIPGRKYI